MSTIAAQKGEKARLGPEDLQYLLDNIDTLSDSQLRVLKEELDNTADAVQKENCQENFMDFVHRVWPSFIDGAHHEEMAQAFERVAKGETKRLIINHRNYVQLL